MIVQARAGEGIERREGLVEEQNLRVGHESARRWRRAAAGRPRDRAASARHAPTSRSCRGRGHARVALRSGKLRRARSRRCRRPSARAAGAAPGTRCRSAGCGSAIASPSRRMSPCARAVETGDRGAASVVLPQPEPPISATISLSRTVEVDVGEGARAVGVGLGEVFEAQHQSRAPAPCPASARAAWSRRRAGCRRVLPSSAKAMMAARIWSGLPICWPSTSR